MLAFSLPASAASHCAHKDASLCRLDISQCCACADQRPHTRKYMAYKDGRRTHSGLNRWSHYCTSCQIFWERQIELAGINAAASRIPEFPRPVIETPLPISVPRYRAPVPQRPTSAEPTPSPKTRRKKGVRERRRNEREQASSSASDQVIPSSSNAVQSGVVPMVAMPKPPPYICPAARAQNQNQNQNQNQYNTPRDNKNGRRASSARVGSWVSEPASPPIPLTPASLNSRNRNTMTFGATLDPPGPPPTPTRRPASWQTMATLNPSAESLRPPERYPTLNWEGAPVPDAPDGSWAADIGDEWWQPSTTRGGTNTPRPAEGQTSGQTFSETVSTNPLDETSWANRTRAGTRLTSGNSQWIIPIQFGEPSYPSPQAVIVEDRRTATNASSSSLSSVQPTTNEVPGGDTNSENRGWLGMVGTYVNTAQNRVLEHVNYLGGIAQNSARPSVPMLPWNPPQMQSLSIDTDVRRHTSSHPHMHSEMATPTYRQSFGAVSFPRTQFERESQLAEREREQEQERERTRINEAFTSTIAESPTFFGATSSTVPPVMRRPPAIAESLPIVPPPVPEYIPISPPVMTQEDIREIEAYDGPGFYNRPYLRLSTSTSPIIPDMVASPSDEWEAWDPAMLPAVVSPVRPAARNPSSLDLAQVAEDASVLLELFSKTKPRNDEDISDEYKQMIDSAFESILKIRKEFRLMAARKNESLEVLDPSALGDEDAKADSECIICYDNVADTVLLPCKHLVLCNVCCDKMGIKEKNIPGPRTVQCPICRVKVLDKLKIFRG